MKKILFGTALFLLLFSGSAAALELDAPATIVVQQEQKDVPITLVNDSGFDGEYSLHFFAPFDAVVSPAFGYLDEGEREIASLSILPGHGLEGSTYEAVLEARLGGETAFKHVRVIFKEGEGNGAGNGAGLFGLAGFYGLAGLQGFAGLFSAENVLNGFLVVIAAVLLIAFIARFVKRLEGEK